MRRAVLARARRVLVVGELHEPRLLAAHQVARRARTADAEDHARQCGRGDCERHVTHAVRSREAVEAVPALLPAERSARQVDDDRSQRATHDHDRQQGAERGEQYGHTHVARRGRCQRTDDRPDHREEDAAEHSRRTPRRSPPARPWPRTRTDCPPSRSAEGADSRRAPRCGRPDPPEVEDRTTRMPRARSSAVPGLRRPHHGAHATGQDGGCAACTTPPFRSSSGTDGRKPGLPGEDRRSCARDEEVS